MTINIGKVKRCGTFHSERGEWEPGTGDSGNSKIEVSGR